MRKVQSLVLGDEGFDFLPCLRLSGIGKQVHDDGSFLDGFLDGEEGLSGDL